MPRVSTKSGSSGFSGRPPGGVRPLACPFRPPVVLFVPPAAPGPVSELAAGTGFAAVSGADGEELGAEAAAASADGGPAVEASAVEA